MSSPLTLNVPVMSTGAGRKSVLLLYLAATFAVVSGLAFSVGSVSLSFVLIFYAVLVVLFYLRLKEPQIEYYSFLKLDPEELERSVQRKSLSDKRKFLILSENQKQTLRASLSMVSEKTNEKPSTEEALKLNEVLDKQNRFVDALVLELENAKEESSVLRIRIQSLVDEYCRYLNEYSDSLS